MDVLFGPVGVSFLFRMYPPGQTEFHRALNFTHMPLPKKGGGEVFNPTHQIFQSCVCMLHKHTSAHTNIHKGQLIPSPQTNFWLCPLHVQFCSTTIVHSGATW